MFATPSMIALNILRSASSVGFLMPGVCFIHARAHLQCQVTIPIITSKEPGQTEAGHPANTKTDPIDPTRLQKSLIGLL